MQRKKLKLQFTTETVRVLGEGALRHVHGGLGTASDATRVTCRDGSDACTHTCTNCSA